MKILNIILPIFLFVSCNNFIKSDAEKYFAETFQLIKDNSVKKNDIDWNDLKKLIASARFTSSLPLTVKRKKDNKELIKALKRLNLNANENWSLMYVGSAHGYLAKDKKTAMPLRV